MKFLAKGTTDRIIEGQDDKLEILLRTFRHNLQNKYNRYTFFFFLCEVFNFLIMAFQFYVTGWQQLLVPDGVTCVVSICAFFQTYS